MKKLAVLAAALALTCTPALAGPKSANEICKDGYMECEYVLTYGWVCYCV